MAAKPAVLSRLQPGYLKYAFPARDMLGVLYI